MRMAALRTAAGLLAAFGLVAPSSAQLSYPIDRSRSSCRLHAGGSIDITNAARLAWRCRNGSDSRRHPEQAGCGAKPRHVGGPRAAPDGYTFGAASFAFAAILPCSRDLVRPGKGLRTRHHGGALPMVLLVNPRPRRRRCGKFIDWVKSSRPGS